MVDRHPAPLQLEAWRAFLEAHARVTDTLDRELRSVADLPLVSYDVLVQLSEAGGRRRMSELADAVLLTRSNCTRLVDRLVDAGLVAREPDPVDARVRWAVLTALGRRRLAAASGPHLDGVERTFTAFLDDRDATVLIDVFRRVVAARSGDVAVSEASAGADPSGPRSRRSR